MKGISEDEAKEIYYYDYWPPSGANKVEDVGLAYAILDTEIIAGNYTNNKIRRESRVENLDKYLQARLNHHINYINKHPEEEGNRMGWIKRINDIKHNAKLLREKQKRDNLLKTFPMKYSKDNAPETMSNKEFKKHEKEIDKEIKERFRQLKKTGYIKI